VFELVAPRLARLGIVFVNVYALGEPGGPWVLVDAGLRGSEGYIRRAAEGRFGAMARPEGIVLTHGHFDHVGFAARARAELDVPVWVHTNDVPLARKPWRYMHERPRAFYLSTQVRALPIIAAFLRHRAFWPPPLRDASRFDDGSLVVPGSPRVVFTPGHTLGHCALHFPDRDAVIAGDALVTLDPYTARTGPRLVARAATADSERAMAALEPLEKTQARIVLPGHGPPWREGVSAAVARARQAGAA